MKIIYSVFLSLMFLFVSTSFAQAHLQSIDGSMSVLLHIDPDDSPIAGEVTRFEFSLEDIRKKFNIELCDCRVSINRDGKQIAQYDLPVSSEIVTVLPQKGAYTATLTGSPIAVDAFTPFHLSVAFTVDRENTAAIARASSQTPLLLMLSLGVLLFTVCVFMLFFKKRRKTKKH